MTARYSLLVDGRSINLDASSYPRESRLLSVPTSRTASRPIENPAGLPADAVEAAERVALDALVVGPADRVEVVIVKHLAGGVERRDGYVFAILDSREPGRAIVESSRSRRSVPLAAIVEASDGSRRFSHAVALAQSAALLVADGVPEDEAIESLAVPTGRTAHAIRTTIRHGIAAAATSADRSRAGREPLVAVDRLDVVPAAL